MIRRSFADWPRVSPPLDKETMQAVDRGLTVSLGMKHIQPEEKKADRKKQAAKK